MKAYLNKDKLLISGEVPIKLKDLLQERCKTTQRNDGTFYIEEAKFIPYISLILPSFYILEVSNMEDYYYAPGGYTLLNGSDSLPRLARLINLLHHEIFQDVEDIYCVSGKLRVLADMIDAYNFPVALY